MIGKGPGWSHCLRLIEFFPDLTNLFKFYLPGASQQQFGSVAFFVHTVVVTFRFPNGAFFTYSEILTKNASSFSIGFSSIHTIFGMFVSDARSIPSSF
jgi:hypothetical protein